MNAALSRLWKHTRDSYIAYVLTKEDIHELTYQQAHKGAIHRHTFILLGSLFRLSYVVIFVYFTYINFVTLRYNQTFLSLSTSAGECTEVPKLYSFPHLYADTNGFWESEHDYSPSRAAYKFSLHEINNTLPEYIIFMNEMRDAVVAMGKEGHSHNLAINLLHWCFWEHIMPTSDGKIRRLKFTGDPEFIFDLDQVQGTLGDINHDSCSKGLTSAYDLATSRMVLDFSVSDFESGKCADLLDPHILGYKETAHGDDFSVNLDVGSALTAMAINIDLIPIKDLSLAYVLIESLMYNDTEFRVEVMLNDDFPLQSNLYCLGPNNSTVDRADWYCLLRFGQSYGLPYFQHYGASKEKPTPCACGHNGHDKGCDEFDFLIGAMLYDHNKSDRYPQEQYTQMERAFLPLLEYLFGGPLNGPRIIKDDDTDFFDAAWLSTTHAESGNETNDYDQSFRDDAYRFSNTTFGTASFVSFRAYTKFGRRSINAHAFQVKNGSCGDSFMSEGFDKLTRHPWAPLHEIYYQCTYTSVDALTNGAGIAGGTVSTFLPLVVYLIMTLVMCPNILSGTNYRNKRRGDIHAANVERMFNPDKDKVVAVENANDVGMYDERSMNSVKSFLSDSSYNTNDSRDEKELKELVELKESKVPPKEWKEWKESKYIGGVHHDHTRIEDFP